MRESTLDTVISEINAIEDSKKVLSEETINRLKEKMGSFLLIFSFFAGTDFIACEKVAEKYNESVEDIRAFNTYLYQKQNRELEQEHLKNINDIKDTQERGHKVIAARKHASWDIFVEDETRDGLYKGFLSKSIVEILEKLEDGTPLDKIVEAYNEAGHSGVSGSIVRIEVLRYANNGYSFAKATHYGEWTERDEELAQQIMHEFDNEQHVNTK